MQFVGVVRHKLDGFARQSNSAPSSAPLQCFWGAALVEPLLCGLSIQVLLGAKNLFSSAEEDKPQPLFLSSWIYCRKCQFFQHLC